MTVLQLKQELELANDNAEVVIFVDDNGVYYREVETAAATDQFETMYFNPKKHDVGHDKNDGKECLVIYPLLNNQVEPK